MKETFLPTRAATTDELQGDSIENEAGCSLRNHVLSLRNDEGGGNQPEGFSCMGR